MPVIAAAGAATLWSPPEMRTSALVEKAELMPTAMGLAAEIASKSPVAIRLAKNR